MLSFLARTKMKVIMESDVCGNCLEKFLHPSSRVTKVLLNTREGENILPIYQVLSVIFQRPPFNKDGNEAFQKNIFEPGENEVELALCVSCSTLLTSLYTSLIRFVYVSKLESKIGQVLNSLDERQVLTAVSDKFVKREPAASPGHDNSANEPSDWDERSQPESSEPRRVVVKVENGVDDDVGSHGRQDSSPATPAPVNDPPEVQDGEETITASRSDFIVAHLKCPTCFRRFLQESTLLCHRRIIHKDPIAIPRPPPISIHSTARQPLKIFNGKTFPCPLCRLNIARTEIRTHLEGHTLLISNPMVCLICGKSFKSQIELTIHRKVHTTAVPCRRCGVQVTSPDDLLLHNQTCSFSRRGGAYPCKICEESFNTPTQLVNHRTRVHGHFWKCKLCGIRFRDQRIMRNHMSTHKQKKLFKCKICEKSFDRRDALRLHITRFHKSGPPSVPPPPEDPLEYGEPLKENRFFCKACNSGYPKPTDLDIHLIESHTEQNKFKCCICCRNLQDDYCLKLHMKIHGETKPLQCFHANCDKSYRDKTNFFLHLKEKHGMDISAIIAKYPEVFRNTSFDYSVRSMNKRIGQMKYIPKTGKFPCETCGKEFSVIYTLRSHIKLVHEKVREYLCKYCGKAFARKTYFNMHERLHVTNEMPYKCHLCGKGFRMPGTLKMHLKSNIHNSARDYVCDICGKGFNRNDNLRCHVKAVHLKMTVRKPRSKDCAGHSNRIRLATELHQSGQGPSTAQLISEDAFQSQFSSHHEISADSTSQNSNHHPVLSLPLSTHETGEHLGRSNNLGSYSSAEYLRGFQYRL